MKVIKDTLEIEIDRWDDPGDYPNAVASGPLPSYDYISDVIGEVVIELEDGDDPVESGSYASLEEVNYDVFEALEEAVPEQVTVSKWDVTREGNRLTITVADFEAEPYEAPEPDYDPY